MSDLGPSPLSSGDELPVEAARAAILRLLQPISGTESVALRDAGGRILTTDVISPIDVPAHDNSAMDGYALRGADLADPDRTRWRVLPGTRLAGRHEPAQVGPGECLRIMTGAVMPEGADTVVPLELCQARPGEIELAAGLLRPGDNRRRRGEDLARGGVALAAGRTLRPADLGLLASLGLQHVTVRRRLRVALFSTGDELCDPGQPLGPGQIYDSNRYSLLAALQRLGVQVLDLGLVPDQPEQLRNTLDRAIEQADAVITSGGVSMGDADYTRDLLAARGEIAFWKVAMRPGRPFAFGLLHGEAAPTGSSDEGRKTAYLFALPGNPVAALVTFHALVQGALRVLGGATESPPLQLRVRSATALRKRPGRTEFQRAVVGPAPDGGLQVRTTGAQGAGILRSMTEANALLVLGHDQGPVAAGEEVEVWLFDGLV